MQLLRSLWLQGPKNDKNYLRKFYFKLVDQTLYCYYFSPVNLAKGALPERKKRDKKNILNETYGNVCQL